MNRTALRWPRKLFYARASWRRILTDFPWRSATRQYLLLAGGFILGIVVTAYWLRHAALSFFAPAATDAAIVDFDLELTTVIGTVVLLGLIWLVLVTYWGLRPLGRILRFIRRRGQGLSRGLAWGDEVFSDEPGEWNDLEVQVGALSRSVRLRESEVAKEREELTTILGSVNEAIVAMGKDTEPLYFNAQFAVLFGGARSAEATMPTLRERFRVPELLDGFQRVLSEGKTRTFRVRLRTELHPLERDFSIAVSPLVSRDASSAVYGAVAIFHDISELKQTEQMRVDFVANASHELKTPLTSIKGYVDTLKSDFKAGRFDDAPEFITVVSRNVDRLIFLVQDLLDLSTLESGAEVKKTILSPAEVSEMAIRLLEGSRPRNQGASAKAIRLSIKTDRVFGDARRIEQVLVNLVDNALKYSPESGEVRVTWEEGTGANTGETVLRVQDSGPGIADDHMPRLFERFYRVDAGRAREVGGTGLGLAIVKHIVLSHGGSIAVRSKLGEGAEFICRFPNR